MPFELSSIPLTEYFGPSDQTFAQGLPYAHYSKNDKLGRIADWTQDGTKQDGREGRRGHRYRDQQYQTYGSGTLFGYQHDEDDATFSIVDSRSANKARLGATRGTYSRARGGRLAASTGRGGRIMSRQGGGGAGAPGSRIDNRSMGGGKQFRGGRRGGWKDYDAPTRRIKESSVTISPDWTMLEEIEFNKLTKLSFDVGEPVDVETSGIVYYYTKSFDKVSTKNPRAFQITERFGQDFLIGTLEDPTIEDLARENIADVYSTDAIISMIMCAPRSVNPWDIVVTKQDNSLFFDKRNGSPIDTVTVNENALEPPLESSVEDPNNPGSRFSTNVLKINTGPELREEAFYIVSNFAQQVVRVSESEKFSFQKRVPFEELLDDDEVEIASRGYRYRKFDMTLSDEEAPMSILIRTEVDAVQKNANGDDSFLTIKALNEWGSGAVGQIDWRTKLDSQRGAVVATEMKNNSSKLARWAVQSILGGNDTMKLGYVSRANPKDNRKHIILGVGNYKPKELVQQMNMSLKNAWGILRYVTDMCMRQPQDGKFILVKDPNKPILRFYKVPDNSFEDAEGDDQDE